jgi:hypothetical protein
MVSPIPPLLLPDGRLPLCLLHPSRAPGGEGDSFFGVADGADAIGVDLVGGEGLEGFDKRELDRRIVFDRRELERDGFCWIPCPTEGYGASGSVALLTE